ncbi:hypothetical protein CDAR_560061 [Caerostris darwini]|uniref:Uncharacterized protein n=1 Tax=Caerostris darwini TaxID=1538125 RepID=A0AAV4VYR8_9ARAC|nr:hypothetical protein CDAR_560061 [Caerostris darwini]
MICARFIGVENEAITFCWLTQDTHPWPVAKRTSYCTREFASHSNARLSSHGVLAEIIPRICARFIGVENEAITFYWLTHSKCITSPGDKTNTVMSSRNDDYAGEFCTRAEDTNPNIRKCALSLSDAHAWPVAKRTSYCTREFASHSNARLSSHGVLAEIIPRICARFIGVENEAITLCWLTHSKCITSPGDETNTVMSSRNDDYVGERIYCSSGHVA